MSSDVVERPVADGPAEDTATAVDSACRVLACLRGHELFGHEKGHIEVYRSLLRQGHHVHVCLPARYRESAIAERLQELGIPYTRVSLGHAWSGSFIKRHPWLPFYNLWCLLQCARELSKVMSAFKPTHVLLGDPQGFFYFWPMLWWSSLPLIYRAGDRPPPKNLSRWLWRRCMVRSQIIVCISHFIQGLFREEEPSCHHKLVMIHNLSPETSAVRNVGKPISRQILYVGQITENKGLSQLIDAAHFLHSAGRRDMRFIIVGGSTYTRDYELRLQKSVQQYGLGDIVVFAGHQSNVLRYYNSAHLHVAPTLTAEPLGNVVLEAKACGIPSVVFPSGGLVEMVQHQVDGYVCAGRTAADLAEGIDWCLASEQRRLQLAEAAYADAETRFGRERFDRSWAAALQAAPSASHRKQAASL